MTAGLQSKLKTGDDVIVVAGKDKGQRGKITSVNTAKNRVYVEGVNIAKKHLSQREAMRLNKEPGIVEKPLSVRASNVMLADPKDGTPTRVGYKLDKDGSKVRFAKKSGETINVVAKAKGK